MLKEKAENILVIGIGNSGRSDDGIGWLMSDIIEDEFPMAKVIYRYQLQVEDAELISRYKTVIFIDATKEKTKKGFFFRSCSPVNNFSFSSHSLDPETVLWLENDLFQTDPKSYILGVEGYSWDLSCEMSKKGNSNMLKAKSILIENLSRLKENKAPICYQN